MQLNRVDEPFRRQLSYLVYVSRQHLIRRGHPQDAVLDGDNQRHRIPFEQAVHPALATGHGREVLQMADEPTVHRDDIHRPRVGEKGQPAPAVSLEGQ